MNYNVLHIQTIANSEGCTPLRIHRALLEQGVNSMMLVVQGSGDAIYQATQSSTLNRYVPPKNRLIRKIKVEKEVPKSAFPSLTKSTDYFFCIRAIVIELYIQES